VEILKPHGIHVDESFYRERISGRSNAKIVEDLLPHLSAVEGREVFEAKERAFRERLDELEPLPGLLDFIGYARERGLALVLVTNAPSDNVLAVLAALDLAEDFDEVVLSDEVGAVKPDPAPYSAAVEALGIPSGEALAFEDSTSGIASSVGAGVPTVGIASTREPQVLKEAGAFAVFEDFTDPGLRSLLDP
jgi:HAD superfamily hydrolase (TIGR01509 family)